MIEVIMKGFANEGTSTQPHKTKAAYLRQRGAHPVFIKEKLQKNGSAGFGYIANNGAMWDTNRILFYSNLLAQKNTSGRRFFNDINSRELNIDSSAYKNQFGSNLKIHCRLYKNDQQTGQHEEDIKLLSIDYSEINSITNQESCLFLGLTIAETASIKAAAASLSDYHPRYIYLEPYTSVPTPFTDTATNTKINVYQYRVKVQGYNSGNLVYAEVNKPGSSSDPMIVYSLDRFFYNSKAFSENETITLTTNQVEFHIYPDKEVECRGKITPDYVNEGNKIKYIYHHNGVAHTLCELKIIQSNKYKYDKEKSAKGVPPGFKSDSPKTGVQGETKPGNTDKYYYYPIDPTNPSNPDNSDPNLYGDICIKAGSTIKYFVYKKEKAYMVFCGKDQFLNLITIDGHTLKIEDNPSITRRYLNPNVLAAFLGACIRVRQFNQVWNGGAHSMGTGYPSVEHVNGEAIDMRYQDSVVEINSKGKPEFRMADNKPAKEKNMEVINAMSMFYFGKAYVGTLSRYTYLRLVENGKSKDIDVQPMVGHDNHLHVSKLKRL